MNRKRIRKLANFLKKLPESKFDFAIIGTKINTESKVKVKCPTVGCAMGWMPSAFPLSGLRLKVEFEADNAKANNCNLVTTSPTCGKTGDDLVADFLDIDNDIVEMLFYPNYYFKENDTTAKEVAKRLELLLDYGTDTVRAVAEYTYNNS